MGAYFSNTLPSLIGGEYINAIPQVENQNTFLTDTSGWIQIQGCFTALGGEQFITIGNFHDNASTDTLRIQSTNPLTGTGTDVAYYYIDDITLIDQSTVGIKEDVSFLNEVVGVSPNPTNGKLKVSIQNLKDKENCHLKITDIVGRNVVQLNFEEEIDISFLEQGIYFITLEQEGKTLVTKKVIKE